MNLKSGIVKAKPLAPADDQKKLDAIVAALDPAIDALGNKDTVSLSVAGAVLNMARNITAMTGDATAGAAPAEDTGFDEPVVPAEAAPPEAVPADAPPADTPAGPATKAAAPDAAQ